MAVKVNNRRKYTFTAVCEMLGDEFFLEAEYVGRLIQKLS